MSQTLKINNYSDGNILQQTRLDTAAPAGSAVLDVVNNAGIAAADYIVPGTLGSDTAELLSVQSVTGATTITPTATTKIDHSRYDYVSKLSGNQIRIYRAPDANGLQPADIAFASIATVDIQIDRAYTEYNDSSGGAGYWYKFTYYNSTAATETNLADSKAVRGGSSGDYCSVEDIRVEAGFKFATYVTDFMIDLKRQAAQDEINGTLHGFYSVPFQPPINPFISDIARRLAAGLLLLEQYGQLQRQNTADGQTKVDKARADLQALATKQKVLVDANGASMAEAGSTGGISGWPNASTDTTASASGGAPRVFRMGDIQGQPQSTDDNGNPVGNLYYGRRW